MIQTGLAQAPTTQDEVAMTDADFERIARIAHREFGLNLTESKKSLVFSRLGRRLRTLGLPNFQAYFAYLEGPTGASEMTELLSTLTTNVTKFFREKHHYEHLKDQVLPPLITRAKSGGRVRFWSAGCSSGPEVYSLAMILLDEFPQVSDTNAKILATDIDPAILDKAKRGVYDMNDAEEIPPNLRSRFTQTSAEGPGTFSMAEPVKKLITFGITNLIAELPVSGPFDVIFCRNVAIYFDKTTQAHVWNKFCQLLAPGGHLYIGHSERLSGPASEQMISAGITTYQKV